MTIVSASGRDRHEVAAMRAGGGFCHEFSPK